MNDNDDKKKSVPNAYQVGDSWLVEFVFKGERYREKLGKVSRGFAATRAAKRRIEVSEGKRAVNGRKWSNAEWIAEVAPSKAQDPLFAAVLDQWLDWSKNGTRRKYMAHRHAQREAITRILRRKADVGDQSIPRGQIQD
jgi:hypothetical protein